MGSINKTFTQREHSSGTAAAAQAGVSASATHDAKHLQQVGIDGISENSELGNSEILDVE